MFLVVILCIMESDLRTWMLEACGQGMCGGDYVFIYFHATITTSTDMTSFQSPDFWQAQDGQDSIAKQAYQNLIVV